MDNFIEKKVNEWAGVEDKENFRTLNHRINYLDNKLFQFYEPTKGPHLSFMDRLEVWLKNISDDDKQRLLFKLVPELFYVGEEELSCLYRM